MRGSLLGQTWPGEAQERKRHNPEQDHPQASQARADCSPRSRLSRCLSALESPAPHLHAGSSSYGGNEIQRAPRDSRELEREYSAQRLLATQSATGHVQESFARETSKPGTTPQSRLWFLQDRFRAFAAARLPS